MILKTPPPSSLLMQVKNHGNLAIHAQHYT